METGYEFDSRSFSSAITPLESLAPFPPSDFTPSDHNHDLYLSRADSFLLDSSLSLLNRHHLDESTRLDQLFQNNVATTTPFLHLPDLKSLEQTTTAMEETTKKMFPFLSSHPPVAKRHKKLGSSSSSTSGSPTASSSHTIDGGANKRKKISDKIRSLEKLMPWERKMNFAMILEESHKYIRFLQSQIATLRWMPLESVFNTAGEIGETDLLKSLTRQQILQVLANSPGSRNVLATRGVCLFSYEQLLSLKTMSTNP